MIQNNRAAFWLTRWSLAVAAAALLPQPVTAAEVLVVRPATDLAGVREKLANDPGVTEVVFEGGTYEGGLRVEGGKGADDPLPPLLIRAADGAKVIFEGSAPLDAFEPHES